MNRQDLLIRSRQMSDTLDSTVDYPNELLLALGSMVHIDEWRKVLGAAPYLRTNVLTPTLDANRTFAWADLSTGTGNNRKVAHRVLEMTNSAGDVLTYAQPDRLRLADTGNIRSRELLWTRVGDRVQTYGTTAGSTVTVLVNWTPTPVGSLASDADAVDWLEDWEPVLFYEIAAHALAKGGREMRESRELMGVADLLRQKMLATVSRDAAQPFILGADDHPWEWGG